MEQAIQKYGLKVSPDSKFVQLRDFYEETTIDGKIHFLIFTSVVYLIFVLIPSILYFKYSKPKVIISGNLG
jgi:hypothetical protein